MSLWLSSPLLWLVLFSGSGTESKGPMLSLLILPDPCLALAQLVDDTDPLIMPLTRSDQQATPLN